VQTDDSGAIVSSWIMYNLFTLVIYFIFNFLKLSQKANDAAVSMGCTPSSEPYFLLTLLKTVSYSLFVSIVKALDVGQRAGARRRPSGDASCGAVRKSAQRWKRPRVSTTP
jgi:hypothetical protein